VADQQIHDAIHTLMLDLARVEEDLASVAFWLTDPGRRGQLQWISTTDLGSGISRDGLSVYPRALACSWP
jgi:hypothetical protein